MSSSISSSSVIEQNGESPQQAKRYHASMIATAVAAFALVWLYVAWFPMAFLSRDYPLWLAKKEMIETCSVGSVAIVGDSRAVAAIMPRLMPLQAANLAMSGTSPIETYFTIARLLRCSSPPKLVIVAHGTEHFAGDASYWEQARLGLLGYADLRDIDASATALNDDGSRNTLIGGDGLSQITRDLLYSIHFPPLYFANLVNGYVGLRWWHNNNSLRDALHSRGQALFGRAEQSDGLADDSGMAVFHASPLIDHYFVRMIDLLQRRNIQVLYVAAPLNQSTYDHLNQSVETGFALYLQLKAIKYDNFLVGSEPVTCWPDEFFGDAWHFNGKGAEAYTLEFGKWLQGIADGREIAHFADRCFRHKAAEAALHVGSK